MSKNSGGSSWPHEKVSQVEYILTSESDNLKIYIDKEGKFGISKLYDPQNPKDRFKAISSKEIIKTNVVYDCRLLISRDKTMTFFLNDKIEGAVSLVGSPIDSIGRGILSSDCGNIYLGAAFVDNKGIRYNDYDFEIADFVIRAK